MISLQYAFTNGRLQLCPDDHMEAGDLVLYVVQLSCILLTYHRCGAWLSNQCIHPTHPGMGASVVPFREPGWSVACIKDGEDRTHSHPVITVGGSRWPGFMLFSFRVLLTYHRCGAWLSNQRIHHTHPSMGASVVPYREPGWRVVCVKDKDRVDRTQTPNTSPYSPPQHPHESQFGRGPAVATTCT